MIEHDDPVLPFDNPLHEQEWLAQESAMRRERLDLDPAADDARSHRYRLLARALGAAPPDGLPADFAQRLSAQVAAPAFEPSSTMAFERVLTTALAGSILLAAIVATVIYGVAWWPSFELLLPKPATAQWMLALGGCLVLSWVFGEWARWSKEPPQGG